MTLDFFSDFLYMITKEKAIKENIKKLNFKKKIFTKENRM